MKRLWIPALMAAVAVAAVTGCNSGSDAAETSPLPVVVVRARGVETRSFTDVVTASGQWRSTGEAAVTAPFAAVVDSLGVQIGDHVATGQVLCILVTRVAQAALRGAALMAAEARDPGSRLEAERAAALALRDRVPIPVVAPRPGVVLRISVVTGSEVAESGEILALLPVDGMVFEARLNPADAPRVHSGQNGSITEEGRPPRRVVVQTILPTVGEGDQSVLAWLRPAPGGGAPAIGRFGTATIEAGPPRSASAVPDSAVVQDDLTGVSRVAVISAAGRIRWTPVTLGAGDRGWYRLIDPPLFPGTLVVTGGHRGLPDSTLVKVAG